MATVSPDQPKLRQERNKKRHILLLKELINSLDRPVNYKHSAPDGAKGADLFRSVEERSG
jgi:hypothetical protein